MKIPRILSTLLTAGLALATLLPTRGAEAGQLLIWINGDKGYRGLQQVADRFSKDLGIPVKVEAPEGVTDKFFQAAQAGKERLAALK